MIIRFSIVTVWLLFVCVIYVDCHKRYKRYGILYSKHLYMNKIYSSSSLIKMRTITYFQTSLLYTYIKTK